MRARCSIIPTLQEESTLDDQAQDCLYRLHKVMECIYKVAQSVHQGVYFYSSVGL